MRFIDIAFDTGDESGPDSDPRFFASQKTGRGMLAEGWRETVEPVMCCYKLAQIKCEIPFFTSRCEGAIENVPVHHEDTPIEAL